MDSWRVKQSKQKVVLADSMVSCKGASGGEVVWKRRNGR